MKHAILRNFGGIDETSSFQPLEEFKKVVVIRSVPNLENFQPEVSVPWMDMYEEGIILYPCFLELYMFIIIIVIILLCFAAAQHLETRLFFPGTDWN